MASRVIERPRHLRVVRIPEETTPAAVAQQRIVLVLIGATAALTAIGLIMVLSASSVSSYARYGSSFLFFKRQAMYAVVGTLLLLLTSRMRYRVWQRLTIPLLAVTTFLLLLVLHPGAGTVAGGSARWIAVGPVTIQPSELAKLATVTFAATILTRKWNVLDRPLHLALPLLPVVAVICGLIMLQPDLGTTLIVGGAVFVLVFAAGAKLRHMLLSTALAGGAVGILAMAEPYRRARLLSFLHPCADRMNAGWQLCQSLIGLGSGGWFGVGLGMSRQKWMYVPNAHTDFIFSILGEELGLVGELVVLALFAALLYAGIRVAIRAPDRFGRLLAAGIVGWLGLQTLVNLGAVTGLLPVTGVPLPLVSFGGSSLVVTLAAIGILINVGRAGTAPLEVAPGPGRARPASRPARSRKRSAKPGRRPSARPTPSPTWGSAPQRTKKRAR